ncbi:hypothetical protein SS50377_26751 [Spironucleus salmonicida]|uniref:Uncharacterized protein n=1 Tax=Spironucleus salmonicida TaxID=348837 RepID=V6LXE7_9EUKA|nr:hypothetical protein SS50377_26751 [Spironucleus salmonicida]|eukprot:EST49220.1 hypothetical protein SS50377_10439 [Spironucleus salmonicida]
MIGTKQLVRLQCQRTKKFVRICKDGKVEALDGGSRWSTFHMSVRDANTYLFQIADHDNMHLWLQVTGEGQVNGHGQGGPTSQFKMKMYGPNIVLSPNFNLDWDIGFDSHGQPLPCSQVEDGDKGALLKVIKIEQ